ncbi:YihY/virulence factor BrkB family protein [Kribbella sp. NPDC023972]|uniref:YihY/virulence factor BrkB family protein n=1 Tax=Kribbella sp. NPDC023972 TaxID=3154795 RepID=UPI0033F73BE6
MSGGKRQWMDKGRARIGTGIAATARSAWRHRVLGMAAEIAFWMLLALPPLVLCLLGLVGYLESVFGADLGAAIEQRVLEVATQALTPETVADLVQPLLTQVLTDGRADIASAGFLLAIWAGSTATASYVNAIAIAYGQRSERGAVHSRLLALGIYLAGVVTGVVVLPLLVIGPRTVLRLIPDDGHDLAVTTLRVAYWPTILILSILALVTLYHYAVPLRTRWRDHLLGAAIATGIWLAGAAAVRAYLRYAFDSISVYGPVSTPIAALFFFYLTALAVLLGAEANAHTAVSAARPRNSPRRRRTPSASPDDTDHACRPTTPGSRRSGGSDDDTARQPSRPSGQGSGDDPGQLGTRPGR